MLSLTFSSLFDLVKINLICYGCVLNLGRPCNLHTEFDCSRGKEPHCIQIGRVCDRINDCGGYEDESSELCSSHRNRSMFGLLCCSLICTSFLLLYFDPLLFVLNSKLLLWFIFVLPSPVVERQTFH